MDDYGRPHVPTPGSPQRLSVDWQQVAVNGTLSCKEPGCVASTVLTVFNGTQEHAQHCRLSVSVQHYSGDSVEWVSVMGSTVSSKCTAKSANFCGKKSAESGSSLLFPCVLDLNLEHLMPSNGTLKLEAKVPDNAPADCTSDGKLLQVVPTVVCYVQKRRVFSDFVKQLDSGDAVSGNVTSSTGKHAGSANATSSANASSVNASSGNASSANNGTKAEHSSAGDATSLLQLAV